MMYTVAAPRVWSAASNASRSEIPSRPGFAFSAAIEDTSPLTTSAVVVTTTVLRETTVAREPATGAARPIVVTRARVVARPAPIFTARS